MTPHPHGLSMACPVVWDFKRRPCIAWGAPMSHGCQRAPDHEGIHVCPCGSRHISREESPSASHTTAEAPL